MKDGSMIEKDVLISLIEQGMSISKIGKHFNKSKNSICYWLAKYKLKTKIPKGNNKDWKNLTEHKCSRCKIIKPIDEFGVRKRGGRNSYCFSCSKEHHKNKNQKSKQIAVDYKGGKCCICGYNKCLGALEFHHVDPTTKEFGLSGLRYIPLHIVKKELDKCVLLCANCHREVHSKKGNNAPSSVSFEIKNLAQLDSNQHSEFYENSTSPLSYEPKIS